MRLIADNRITSNEVRRRYVQRLDELGNVLLNNKKFGADGKVDYLEFLKIYYLSDLAQTFESDENKEYLKIRNKDKLIGRML